MRTTLTLEPDAFEAAQAYAKARALRIGQAVSEMIRLAQAQSKVAAAVQLKPMPGAPGLWSLDLPVISERVSAEQVASVMAQSDQEEDVVSIAFANGQIDQP
jgi:hypothetical protein